MTGTLPQARYICVNGRLVPWEDATIHVSSVSVKYGTNVFEGLAAYAGEGGECSVFRVKEHLARLRDGLRLMQMDCDYRDQDYLDAVRMSLTGNGIRGDAHIRLTVFITGEGPIEGRGPTALVCMANPRAAGPLESKAVHAAVSTWRRIDDAIMPPRVKSGAFFHNSRLGVLEARRNRYDEAIFLTLAGKISEAANSCFFMVRNGVLLTPPITASIQESITRLTLLELAADDLGLRAQERDIDRSELYLAEEIFLCGTSAEIRPVLSVDRRTVGNGQVGAVTRRLWDAYETVLRGRNPARTGWLTPMWQAAD